MANSIIVGGLKCGMDVSIATPRAMSRTSGCWTSPRRSPTPNSKLTTDPMEAAQGADAVFTDVWASMGQEGEKAERENAFVGYQVNSRLLGVAKPDCMVQHCLPRPPGRGRSPRRCWRPTPPRSLTRRKTASTPRRPSWPF